MIGGRNRMLLVCCILGVLPMSISCSDEITATPNTPFVLAIGQAARLDNGSLVTFVGVSEDSRCPKGAQCFWAGQAKIDLYIGEPGSGKELQLIVPGMKDEVEVKGETDGLSIMCTKLAPYTDADTPIVKEDYKLTLTFK